ncbi:hypothetical protein Hanom_Chr01g00043731 [Helianthus anomalus]
MHQNSTIQITPTSTLPFSVPNDPPQNPHIFKVHSKIKSKFMSSSRFSSSNLKVYFSNPSPCLLFDMIRPVHA